MLGRSSMAEVCPDEWTVLDRTPCSTSINLQLKEVPFHRHDELSFPHGQVHHGLPSWQKLKQKVWNFVLLCSHVSFTISL